MATATLIAVFIYWGWDTAVAVNEETKDPEKTPGRAGDHLDGPAACHLRDGQRRHGGLRRDQRYRSGTGQSRQRGRCVRGARADRVRGFRGGQGLEILLILSVLSSAAASPRRRSCPLRDIAGDGCLQGAALVVRQHPPAVPHPDGVDESGWGSCRSPSTRA